MNENNAIAPKGINTLAPQASDEDALKAKYGKVYRVGLTIPVDDEHEQEFAYFFKRPSITSYDRYVKTASKIGITKASRAFMLDCVTDEDRDRLTADMEEYPGVGITVGGKLTEILGLTDSVNLKRL